MKVGAGGPNQTYQSCGTDVLLQKIQQHMTWQWFKVLRKADPELDWEKLKHTLFDRYRVHYTINSFPQLKMFNQEGSLDECTLMPHEHLERMNKQGNGLERNDGNQPQGTDNLSYHELMDRKNK